MRAIAARPQRDGTSQENCSRPGTPCSFSMAPLNTICTTESSTSSGIVASSLRTRADTSRPSIIAEKDSSATAMISSASGGSSTPLCTVTPLARVGLRSTPARPTTVSTAACPTVIVPSTTTLETR